MDQLLASEVGRATPAETHTGLYKIPGHPRYLISQQGDVYDTEQQCYCSINQNSAVNVTLYQGAARVRVTRRRLMATTFVRPAKHLLGRPVRDLIVAVRPSATSLLDTDGMYWAGREKTLTKKQREDDPQWLRERLIQRCAFVAITLIIAGLLFVSGYRPSF